MTLTLQANLYAEPTPRHRHNLVQQGNGSGSAGPATMTDQSGNILTYEAGNPLVTET